MYLDVIGCNWSDWSDVVSCFQTTHPAHYLVSVLKFQFDRSAAPARRYCTGVPRRHLQASNSWLWEKVALLVFSEFLSSECAREKRKRNKKNKRHNWPNGAMFLFCFVMFYFHTWFIRIPRSPATRVRKRRSFFRHAPSDRSDGRIVIGDTDGLRALVG